MTQKWVRTKKTQAKKRRDEIQKGYATRMQSRDKYHKAKSKQKARANDSANIYMKRKNRELYW